MRAMLPLLALPLVLTSTPQDPTWETYTPPDSSFSVLLPESPTVSRFYSLTPRGFLPTHSVSAEEDRRATFQVVWTDHLHGGLEPAVSPELFTRARDALIEHKGGGEVVTDAADSVAGQVGHHSTIRMGNGRILHLRFIALRHRFYQLMAETDDEPAAREWAARFLESFTPSGVVRI